MFPYKSIGIINKYVPIYSSVFIWTHINFCAIIMVKVEEDTQYFELLPGRRKIMPVSEAQKKASVRYLEKLDEVRIRMPKGYKDSMKAHAEAHSESVNGFINRAIQEAMERDNGVLGSSTGRTEGMADEG